jgi:hypothetical protein
VDGIMDGTMESMKDMAIMEKMKEDTIIIIMKKDNGPTEVIGST